MTFDLVLRSVGRVLWFAVVGAFFIAIMSVPLGLFVGATQGWLMHREMSTLTQSSSTDWMLAGAFTSLLGFTMFAFVASFFIFCVAGCLACFVSYSDNVLGRILECARFWMVVGLLSGAFLGLINSWIWRDRVTIAFLQNLLSQPSQSFLYGAALGFIFGTFYGAIVGAKREIARQKMDEKAALSTLESAAS